MLDLGEPDERGMGAARTGNRPVGKTGRDEQPCPEFLDRFCSGVEPGSETALMLGRGKSRGYNLEMIGVDFLAGDNLGNRRR